MPAFWTETYRQRFQELFQKPFGVQVYHDEDVALKLATHDLAMHDYRVYASMGLADKLIENEDDDFGEVILYADVPDKEVPQLFVNALFFILRHDIPLGSRFAIGFGTEDHPFTRRYHKSSLYFSRAYSPDGRIDRVRRGESFGRVWQAYFITPEEDEYLENFGADAFDKEFWKQFADDSEVRDRTELPVDEAAVQAAQGRLRGHWLQARDVLSVRRKSCV